MQTKEAKKLEADAKQTKKLASNLAHYKNSASISKDSTSNSLTDGTSYPESDRATYFSLLEMRRRQYAQHLFLRCQMRAADRLPGLHAHVAAQVHIRFYEALESVHLFELPPDGNSRVPLSTCSR